MLYGCCCLWLLIAVVCLVIEIRLKSVFESDYALEGGETYMHCEYRIHAPICRGLTKITPSPRTKSMSKFLFTVCNEAMSRYSKTAQEDLL